jgi:peptidyl-prolyl cis-trans isomerase SurA
VKFKLLSLIWATGLAFGFLTITPAPAKAQEGELRVVDEVIAQVNDDIITLSTLKREIKERIETLKQGGMTDQQAMDEVTKHKPELIATLVNEQLLMQKGKELEMTEKVEAEVNKRLKEVADEQGIKSIVQLEKAMVDSGVDPAATRQMLRREIMKQAVIQEEVDAKLFWGLSIDELHKYFDAHKDKFRKPESVTISEIYLGLAGKNEPEVKAIADKLVAQLRAGADFGAIAAANSEREENGVRVAPKTHGEVGTFEVPNLRSDIAEAIKNVKVGAATDPVRTNDGYQIFRVDKRTPASDASVFNENQVREAITAERSPKAREDYLQHLRDEAYITIAPDYQEGVAPLLKLKPEAVVITTGDGSTGPEKKKGKGKFLKIFPKP